MTKAAAIQSFFGSFGWNAYPEASVPGEGSEIPAFPYITYELVTGSALDKVSVSCSLWDRGETWATINAKVEYITANLKEVTVLQCDGGAILVRREEPFAQTMGDDTDDLVKRRILNFEFTYIC